jgi:hypothetical protein
MGERLLREAEVRSMLGNIGETAFRYKYRPRLTIVRLAPKTIAFTASSVESLVSELISESASMPVVDPMPNQRRRAGLPPMTKKTKRARR